MSAIGLRIVRQLHWIVCCLLLVAGLTVMAARPIWADEFNARHLGDYGNVTVMEVSGGSYDANSADGSVNAIPRQAIAKEFYRLHKDEYDFIVIFTNFDFNMPEATVLGFYVGVKNDITGVGQKLYDYSSFYGSAGKLQGTIDMGNLATRISNPLDAGFEDTLKLLSHELQHRWGAYVRFKDADGTLSTALLGKDGAHWSFKLDSKASLMYGHQWRDNGDGTFTAVGARNTLSPLDLYLMGMIDKSKVPPMLLIENPSIDPLKVPEPGTTITGTARYVTIEDIIAAEGERVPAFKDAPKQFRMAFVYAVAPGSLKQEEVAGIEHIRNGFLTRYSILTDGKGLVQVASLLKDEVATNPGLLLPSVTPRTLPPNIDSGVTWLMAQQRANGSWYDISLTTERDTAEVVATLQRFPSALQAYQAGSVWLGGTSSDNTDFLARRLEALGRAGADTTALVNELLANRNGDGGWGAGKNFLSTPVDTALSLKALSVTNYADASVTAKAIAYLQATQNGDGGWSGDDALSSIQPTAAVLSAFVALRDRYALDSSITKARVFLASKQNTDGGFGNSPSTIYDSALAVGVLQAAGADSTITSRGVGYLLAEQSENGSWLDSPYETALAVQAVWMSTVQPDLSVKPEDISIIPAKISSIPTTVVLNVKVSNQGRTDVPLAMVAVYDGAVSPDKRIANQVAAFPALSTVNLTFSISVADSKAHNYIVVVDPEAQLVESAKGNNSANVQLMPEFTYDFKIAASDVSVAPATVDMGKDVTITLKVTNSGTSDAYNVPIRVFVDQPGAALEIATLTADIPAGGTVSKQTVWKASRAGVALPVTVQLDPNNAFNELSKDNNSAAQPVTVNASVLPNLAVSYKDMLITPTPAREGGSASISVLVKNTGYSDVQNVKVNVYRGVPENGGQLLGSPVLPSLAIGQEARISVEWADIAVFGSQIISVQVDPDNSLAEIVKEDNFTFLNLDVLSLPDLAISPTSIVVTPSAPKTGDQVSIAVTVQNAGDQEASNVVVQVAEGGAIIGSTVIGSISGNGQATATLSYPAGAAKGSHPLTVTVDPANLIVERSKANNSATRIFSIQDANLWLTEPYFSPDNDGVKDSTDFSFRLVAPAKVTVQVVNKKSVAVRTFSGGELDNTAGTTITWDGRNDAGSVVSDGTYQMQVVSVGSGYLLANLPVELDTNRSALADALGTKYLLQNNMTCQMPDWLEEGKWGWLPYDAGIWAQYTTGLYLIPPNGDYIRKINPSDWSDSLYDYKVDPNKFKISPDGASLAFVVWKYPKAGSGNYNGAEIWLQDIASGSLTYLSAEDRNISRLLDFHWSPDSKYLAYYSYYQYIEDFGYSVWAFSLVNTITKEKKVIEKGNNFYVSYDFNYPIWSPDSKKIAYVPYYNIVAGYNHVERIRVSDLAGAVITTKSFGAYNSDKITQEVVWVDQDRMLIGEKIDWETNTLWLFEVNQGTSKQIASLPLNSYYDYRHKYYLAPNNKYIANVYRESGDVSDRQVVTLTNLDGTVTTVSDTELLRVSVEGVWTSADPSNITWSRDSASFAFTTSEYLKAENKVVENLVVYDLAATASKKFAIATSNAPNYDSEDYQEFYGTVFGVLAMLSDKLSVLVDTRDGLVAVNTQNGELSAPMQLDYWWGTLKESPAGMYLYYEKRNDGISSCAKPWGDDVWNISSLLNLIADLRVLKNKTVIRLKGIAADKNFAGYRLEFADLKTPDSWNLIQPPSDLPVLDTFTDWTPPSDGSFNVRLTVWDKAGNQAIDQKRVSWGVATLVTGLYRDNEFIAPAVADNPKKTVTLNYTAVDAVHLAFTVVNEAGETVRSFTREHTGYATDAIVWDGRDEAGSLVPDGRYTIRLFDYEFAVEVDNNLPQVAISLSGISADHKVSLTGSVEDKRLKSWTLQYGIGENPSEWFAVSTDWKTVPTDAAEKKAFSLPFSGAEVGSLKLKRYRVVADDYAGNRSTMITPYVDSRVVMVGARSESAILSIVDGSISFAKGVEYTLLVYETLPAVTAKVVLQYADLVTPWRDVAEATDRSNGQSLFSWRHPDAVTKAYALRVKVVLENNAVHFSEPVKVGNVFDVFAECPSPVGDVRLFEKLVKLETKVTTKSGLVAHKLYDAEILGVVFPNELFWLAVPEESESYAVYMNGVGESGQTYLVSKTVGKSCPLPREKEPLDEPLSGPVGTTRQEFNVLYTPKGCNTLSGEIQLPTELLQLGAVKRIAYLMKVGSVMQLMGEVNVEVEGPRRVFFDTAAYPEGAYPLSIAVTYTDNSQKTIDLSKVVIVDHQAPTAQVSVPASSCPVTRSISSGQRKLIDVSGVVADNRAVSSYKLYYGVGEAPAQWLAAVSLEDNNTTRLIEGTGPFSGRLGRWDITDIPGSVFTLKLEVIDTVGNKSCLTTLVKVDREFKVVGYGVVPGLFSPNNDGLLDLTKVGFNLMEPAVGDLSAYNIMKDAKGVESLGQQLQRLKSGWTVSEGSNVFDWDGKDAAGATLPDGKYALALAAADSCGNAAAIWKPVELDRTAPTVAIDYPLMGQPLPTGVMIEVKGSVTDLHFKSYTLEAGEGGTPTDWKMLRTATVQDAHGFLFPWNTYGLKGIWTLKLSAEDAVGNKSVVTSTIDLGIRKDLVKSLAATPALFSPNGDKRLDTTSISYDLADVCDLKVDLLDSTGRSVKNYLLTASPTGKGSVAWDGKNGVGESVPDGVYTIRLSASLVSNQEITQVETVSLKVDTSAPSTVITVPAMNAFVNSVDVSVVGDINDENLVSYMVSVVGPGGTTVLDTGVQNHSGYTFGRLADLAEDTYTLTVAAADLAENQVKHERSFTIDRTAPKATVDAPQNGGFYGAAKNVVDISGSIVEKNLALYSLRYGVGESPVEWKEVVGGTAVPTMAKLGVLKVGKADGVADGAYTLSLYARDKAGLEGEARLKLVVDNTPPETVLASPKDSDYVTKALEISGTLHDLNLDKGTLELSEGGCATASRWSVMKNFTTTVSSGGLDSWKVLPADGEYCLKLTATDKSGNASEAKVSLKIDTVPPRAPQLTGKINNKVDAVLVWSGNAEADLAGYNIYRNGQRLNAVLLHETTYADVSLKEDGYQYVVKAVDVAGNESLASNEISLRIDLTGPSVRISTPRDVSTIASLADISGTAYSQDDFKEYRVSVGKGSSPSNWTELRRSPLAITFGRLAQVDTSLLAEGEQYAIKLEGEDLSGNITTHQVVVTIDNKPPNAPLLLSAVAASADVTAVWQANGEMDLAGYLLYRNDQLANVSGIVAGNLKPYLVTGTSYIDRALPDGTYRYALFAMDQAGNLSGQSNLLEVTVDTHPPHMTITEPAPGVRFEAKLQVKAESLDNDIATVQFQYKRQQDTAWVNLGTPLTRVPYDVSFDPKSLGLPFGDYQLQAVATDKAGKADPTPQVVTVTFADLTSPGILSGLAAKVNAAEVGLSWAASTESDLDGYNLYRRSNDYDRTRINSTLIKQVAYTDSAVPDGSYFYEVTVVDQSGNESTGSNQVTAKVYAPVIRQLFSPTKNAAAVIEGSGATAGAVVEITTTPPGGQAKKVTVTADPLGVFSLGGVMLELGENRYSAVATDSQGNVSRASEIVVAVYDLPPAAPTGLAAEVLPSAVNLTWNPNAEPDVIGYNVYLQNTKVNRPEVVTGGLASASYNSYYHEASRAVDGNYSTYWSSPYSYGQFAPVWWQVAFPSQKLINRIDIAWTSDWYTWNPETENYNLFGGKDFEVQGWSGSNWVTLKTVTGNAEQYVSIDLPTSYVTDKIRLLVTATTDFTDSKLVGISEVKVWSDKLVPTPVYSHSFSTGGEEGETAVGYDFKVSAVDKYGFESEKSASYDTQPPSIPANLVATGQGATIDLAWEYGGAETDLSDFTIYRQAGEEWVRIGRVPAVARTYRDSNLPNGTYHYRITASDRVGNESVPSNEATATAYVVLPTVPTVLKVTSVQTGNALEVSWQTAENTTGTAYNLYSSTTAGGGYVRVNTTPITALSYQHNNLTNGVTYYYVVVAVDSVGNESAYSNEASGVPQKLVTVQPSIVAPTIAGNPVTVFSGKADVAGFAEPGASVEVLRDDQRWGPVEATIASMQTDKVLSEYNYSSFSPDGNHLAYLVNSELIQILKIDDGSVVNVDLPAGVNGFYSMPKWSPNGRNLLIETYDPQLVVYDVNTASSQIITTGEMSYEYDYPAWSKSGDEIVFVAYDQNWQASIWFAKISESVATRLIAVDNDAYAPQISPDLKKVAFFDNDSGLYIFNRQDGTLVLINGNTDGETLAWSPDGTKLAFVDWESTDVHVLNVDSGISLRVTYTEDYYPEYLVWSPDSKQLGYVTYNSGELTTALVDMLGQTKSLYATDDDMLAPLAWLMDGRLALLDYKGVHYIRPAGYFQVPGVTLVAGENLLRAVAKDEAGNISLPSDSITLIYDTGRLPDLSVAESDITFFPQSPKPGEDVLVTVRVHNGKNNSVDVVKTDIYLWDGVNDISLLKSEVIPHIDADGDGAVSFRFNVGTAIGQRTIIAFADPPNSIEELLETNNIASKDLLVTDQQGVILESALNYANYSANQDVQVDLTLRNTGNPAIGIVKVMVEDAAGVLVKLLHEEPLELPFGLNKKLSLSWNTDRTLSGAYRLHAVVEDSAGTAVLAETTNQFAILPDVNVSGRITTDKLEYLAGEDVRLNVSYTNTTSNYLIPQMKLRVRVVDGLGNQMFVEERSFTNLIPGTSASYGLVWATAGVTQASAYTAQLEIVVEEQAVATHTATVQVVSPAAGQWIVTGTLSVDSPVFAGNGVPVSYSIANRGLVPVSGVLKMVLTDPDTQQTISFFEQPGQLAVNGVLSGGSVLGTAGLTLKTYQVALQYSAEATIQTLAKGTVVVKDGIAPSITPVSPAQGGSYVKDVAFAAVVTDDVSGVASVEYAVNDGAWQPLPVVDAPRGYYYAAWVPTTNTNGQQVVQFRARDKAGNISPSVAVPFHIYNDTTPPVLTVSTLSDGAYTNSEVLNVNGIVTDDSGTKELRINDVLVQVAQDGSFSHAVVLKVGPNQISVVANDLAGNQTTNSRTINLDQAAPLLVILTPADNSKTASAPLEVTGTVDETSNVVVKLGGVEQPSLVSGNAFSSSITLVPGINTIEVTAADFAGNTSTQKRTVVYDDQKPALAITVPAQDMRTNKADMTIAGTVSDLYTSVAVSISFDGMTYTLDVVNGQFEQPVSFAAEKNYAIVVTATNEVGATSTAQRNVIYDVTPPGLAINPVTTPTQVKEQVVTGSREAKATVTLDCSTAAVGVIEYPSDTTWRVSITNLAEGENILAVSAFDETGNSATAQATITVITPSAAPVFSHAIFGNTGVVLSGAVSTDSYSCSDAAKTGCSSSHHSCSRKQNGNIGTNAVGPCSIKLNGGVSVFGTALVGVGGDPAKGICRSPRSIHISSIGTLTMVKEMRPMTDPGGGVPMGTLNLTKHATKTLEGGTYRFNSISVSGSAVLAVSGKTTIYVNGNLSVSGGGRIEIAKDASLVMYVNGSRVDLSGGSIANQSNDTKKLIVYGTAGLKLINLTGHSTLYGLIYAPMATINISGGQQTYGSVIGNLVNLTGSGAVHYDEALLGPL